MSLRAKFLRLLHRLLRVPPPEPVVQWRLPVRVWVYFIPQLPPPEEAEFRHVPLSPEERYVVRHRSTNTVQ